MIFRIYDFADSGFATTMVTVLFSQYYAGVVAGDVDGVSVFGVHFPGATLFAWLVSISMLTISLAGGWLLRTVRIEAVPGERRILEDRGRMEERT